MWTQHYVCEIHSGLFVFVAHMQMSLAATIIIRTVGHWVNQLSTVLFETDRNGSGNATRR